MSVRIRPQKFVCDEIELFHQRLPFFVTKVRTSAVRLAIEME